MLVGNSLLMKDHLGHVAGYVLKCARTVRCRLTDDARDTQVTLLFEDGGSAQHPMDSDGGECTWPAPEAGLTGAYALCGDRLLCATDEAARAHGIRALHALHAQAARRKPEGKSEERMRPEKKPSPGSAHEQGFLPASRWPPPPCCPKARYIRGEWIIGQE